MAARWSSCLVCFLVLPVSYFPTVCPLPAPSPLLIQLSPPQTQAGSRPRVLSDAIWPLPRAGPIDTSPEQRGAPSPSSSPTGLTQAQAVFFHVEGSRLWGRREQIGSGHKPSLGCRPGRAEGLRWATPSSHFSPCHRPGYGSWPHIAPPHSSLVQTHDLVAAYKLKGDRRGHRHTARQVSSSCAITPKASICMESPLTVLQ